MFSTCFYTSLGLLSEIVVVVVFSQWHVYVIVHIPYKCSSICALQYNLYISQTVFQPWTFKVVYKLNLLYMYFGSARARAHTHTHTHTHIQRDRQRGMNLNMEGGIWYLFVLPFSRKYVSSTIGMFKIMLSNLYNDWFLILKVHSPVKVISARNTIHQIICKILNRCPHHTSSKFKEVCKEWSWMNQVLEIRTQNSLQQGNM